MLDKIEKTMHKKLDATTIIGPKASKKSSYFDAIMPSKMNEEAFIEAKKK